MPSETEEIVEFRRRLRADRINARRALAADVRNALDARINAHLDAWCSTHAGRRELGFCLPVQGEPDLLPTLRRLHAAGWQLAVPVVVERAQPMSFRRWQPNQPLARDIHGIPCPPAGGECGAPATLLLPVVAVDARGYRLGYGGGYFDRTLAALAASGARPLSIGVGHELARVADIRPRAHDQPLAALLSETGLHWFSRGEA